MKQLAYLLLSCAALVTSCSKDNDATPSGPKEYRPWLKVWSKNYIVGESMCQSVVSQACTSN